jgi:hypothetical protein
MSQKPRRCPKQSRTTSDSRNRFWPGWIFAREMAAKRVSDAVVAIARDDKLVHYKGYGQLDSTKDTPIPLDAVFALA